MPEKDEQVMQNTPTQAAETEASEALAQGSGFPAPPPPPTPATTAEAPSPSAMEESTTSPAADTSQTTFPPETPPPSSKTPSKARRFARKLWRWTLGFLVVFGLGFVVAAWMLYRPAHQQAQQARQSAQAASQQAQTLQNQLQQSQNQVKSLQGQIAALQENAKQAQLEATIDQTLAEAYAVRIALKDNDNTGAALHAEALGKALQALSDIVPAEHADVVNALQSQFTDIQHKLDSPTYADRQLRALIQHLMALKNVLGLK